MMSASSSIDAYDAQMLDFSSDPDVPMNITSTAEFFAEALMDHDGHLAASTYNEHASVEVDMEEYVGDNAEYEMADETTPEYQLPHRDELLDIEVYDASHAPTPLVPPQPLQPSVDVPIDSEHSETTSPTYSEHATLPELQGEPQLEVHPAPLSQTAVDVSHVEPSASGEVVALEVVASESTHSIDVPDESFPPTSESHEHLGDIGPTVGQLVEVPAPAGAADQAEPRVPPITEEHVGHSEVVQQESSEPPTAEPAPLPEDAFGAVAPVQDEKATDHAPATEEESVDPLHISDDVYIDPPPAVLLSVDNLSEPGFALFNPPDVEGESTKEFPGEQKVFSLLLESRPTLYYEPLTSVFEALRQDEGLLSRVPHSFEGELVLDAYDLQLAVSEDNVHSREISLHDLNILHDGSDFAGPLRLSLRANVPRFIIRYYALQEQIQRLHVAAETEEADHDEEQHQHHDAVEKQPLHHEEPVYHPSTHAAVVSEGLEVPSTTEGEEFVKEPACLAELTEKTSQENNELEDTSAVQEPSTEYYEVTREASHALEDENDYEGTNVGDEDGSAKPDSLDADQVHDTVAEDTDAPTTVIGQESEFGGEQTEYVDYVQSEEYDERYGEDLPERSGAASPVQYGEPTHHEGEGELDTPTAVDETQVILLGPDEDEEESAATPIPPHAVLEPESSEPGGVNATNESVLPKHENSSLNREDFVTRGSTNEVDHAAQASGVQEPSTVQDKIFSEIEESDSNFVLMLEREADAEFDRTFSAEQNEKEGSIEAPPQHDEIWDEGEWNDEDAEGDDEADWTDPDADSNESSITLSSKASSKRSYDELDHGVEPYVENFSESSPGSKRPRVQ